MPHVRHDAVRRSAASDSRTPARYGYHSCRGARGRAQGRRLTLVGVEELRQSLSGMSAARQLPVSVRCVSSRQNCTSKKGRLERLWLTDIFKYVASFGYRKPSRHSVRVATFPTDPSGMPSGTKSVWTSAPLPVWRVPLPVLR